MVIVTAGEAYVDIDAYAAILGYAALLNAKGTPSMPLIAAPLNETITDAIRAWNVSYRTRYAAQSGDVFAVMDISDPKHFSACVNIERVVTVIDHHPGFESFWMKRIGNDAIIESIGAAATLVYEQWRQSGLFTAMPRVYARLMATAVLDNTLNFGAHITSGRDHEAYRMLASHGGLAPEWPESYFKDCQEMICRNLTRAIAHDHKVVTYRSCGDKGLSIGVGQLALWDSSTLMDNLQDISGILDALHSPWFMNIIAIKESVSYFYCTDNAIKQWLCALLGINFSGNIARASRPWLRKEIFKADTIA